MRDLNSQANHMVYQLYVLDAILRDKKSSYEDITRALALKPIILSRVEEIRKRL